ncbi:MAG TPA: hypothetical protein VFV94_14615 [Polyangiaceae bacterium]|nr:hypothetical protein [Polyangiaceae bacterium]
MLATALERWDAVEQHAEAALSIAESFADRGRAEARLGEHLTATVRTGTYCAYTPKG